MRPRLEPIHEIRFAARHGFITKPIWKEFFAEGVVGWQNKRWNYLRNSGLFRGSKDHADLLLPNPGHPLVKETAALISRPPRLEQLAHDKVIARSDLQLRRKVRACTTVVEAEAKRQESFETGSYSNYESKKFPDLVVNVDGISAAVEIEMSAKAKARYVDLFEKYKRSRFDFLIYVVSDIKLVHLIRGVAKAKNFDTSKLGIASLMNWCEDPVEAEIEIFSKVRLFKDLLEIV